MQDYSLEQADTTGARFAAPPAEPFMTALPFVAGAALLTYFGVQALWMGDAADRPWAYGILLLAVGAAAGGWVITRRPGPPPVLRFDNFTKTIRFEDATGGLVESIPYDQVGPFEADRYSSTSGNNSYTTYTIAVTLRDGRRLRLCREKESVRDEQLALLRRCLPLA